jgi:hypothetical protein
LAPKSVTVAIEVPQDFVNAVAAAQPAANPNPDAWKSQIRDRVTSAIPAGVAANIHVASFPRGDERMSSATAGTAGAFHRTWIEWGVAGAAVILLSFIFAIGAVRWHRAQFTKRLSHARERIVDDGNVALQNSLAADTAAHRRELVRIERVPSARGRGPHLIQATISSFEDLKWLAPSSLQSVLSAVDSRLWAPALRGASRELSEGILAHMPARAAVLLRHEIEFPGPVRLGDVETAQQEILEVVRRLDHTGDLMLEDREEIRHERFDRV